MRHASRLRCLRKLHERDAKSDRLVEWVELLHDQALLTEGSTLEDPNRFVRRMNALLTQVAAQAVEPSTSTSASQA